MAVFHWLWVTAVVNARFRVSISAYAIDEHTVLDLSECPAPAYSHGPSRQIEGARVQQVANDCGGQSDTSVASHAHISRKTVRVIDDTNADSEADWNASADSSYRKRKSVPFVDLRAVTEKRKASTKKRSRRMKVALCASGKPSNQVVSPRTHENLQMPTGVLVSVPGPRPSQALSVAAALESLSYVSVQRTTQFIPGAIYEGKEFRCFYVR
ncbi:uncharacterized protein TRAVEDRAFT_46322 [Trametes versicolor FP-101664 SS1]|uniref:uncharacterized protein n=1 Tax=Trametes versicolor (strain FP-101664) TaxID=717944 RepID=UPI000462375D|nr:uncharacterized protein TRAVEDRAFT_46322 [Trametes versicolor FP-101664 SS1]EIW61099.1 hypothetical protein TRAVEDRAFT_46322 [Trametes versicolor FP-101664 SS1]